MDAGFGVPTSAMTVCAYGRDEADVIGLTYSGEVSVAAAKTFEAAFPQGEPIAVGRSCDLGSDDTWVVLSFRERRYVVSTQARGCPQVAELFTPDALPRRLSLAMARSWAVGGIPAVVYASPGMDERWMYDYFIGPQGWPSYRASCRFTTTSRMISRIAAAVGMASRAPTMPSRAVPTSAAITTTEPGTSTDFFITRG